MFIIIQNKIYSRWWYCIAFT